MASFYSTVWSLHSAHLLRIPKGAKGAKCDQTIGPDRLFGNKATDKVIKSRNDKTLVVNLPSRLLEIQNMIKKSSLKTGQENVPKKGRKSDQCLARSGVTKVSR